MRHASLAPVVLPPLVLGALLAAGCQNSDEQGKEPSFDTGEAAPSTPSSLPDSLDIDRLLAHLAALDAIGAAQGGNRALGSPGYDESAAYVRGQLEAAGLRVERQPFDHATWSALGPGALEADGLSPFVAGRDFNPIGRSPPGDVRGPVVAVDVQLPPPGGANSTHSGCEAEDWRGFPAGAIALVQRGSCGFSEKVEAAEAAGAVGVILFNEGQSDRSGLIGGNLDSSIVHRIPVVEARTSVATALIAAIAEAEAAGGALQARVQVESELNAIPTENLWVDLPGQTDELVVIGGHLDSVRAGPGINDNGSGVALVLELALRAAALRAAGEPAPRNTLRFAFWGAEEEGLIGSFAYVRALAPEALDAHVANLNFDMVASPNGLRAVYDGDGSAGLGGFPAPDGSDVIEAFFTDHFDAAGQEWSPTAFDGRSDYGPFILAGVAAGGLFTGAEQRKTPEEAAAVGGTAGEALDPCYHQGCDTEENIDPVLFLEMADAAAAATAGAADLSLPRAARQARGRVDRAAGLDYLGGCDHPRPAK